jgi:stress-induced morphogen
MGKRRDEMTTDNATVSEWEKLRDNDSHTVEELLRKHFQRADAYRYNSASLRVRIIDPRFKGLSREARDDLVEPILSGLEQDTQADIMNLVLLYPSEENDSVRAALFNQEFEHPSPSML